MEPVTHALASVALAHAGLNRTTRMALPMAVVAGLGADTDLLSHLGGASNYLEYHRTFFHSALGALLMAAVVPLPFLVFGRSPAYRKYFSRGGELRPEDTVRWLGALLTCFVAAMAHLILDVMNPHGVQVLWPSPRWYALDLVDAVDPWLLIGLVTGLIVPILLRLIVEEIGAKRERKGARRGAIVALAFVVGYCGTRWVMHDRVVDLLTSHRFHEATVKRAAAYPASASPTHWMGIVETENTIEEIEVRLGTFFDADRSRTNYKPEASPAIDAARDTPTVRRFLSFARFPSATVVSQPEGRGVIVEIRDLRFSRPPNAEQRPDVMALVELDPQLHVTRDALIWAKDHKR